MDTAAQTQMAVRYFTALSGQNLLSFYNALSDTFRRAEKMTFHTRSKERSPGDVYYQMAVTHFPLQYTRSEPAGQARDMLRNDTRHERERETVVIERRDSTGTPENVNAILKSAMEMFRYELRAQKARKGII